MLFFDSLKARFLGSVVVPILDLLAQLQVGFMANQGV